MRYFTNRKVVLTKRPAGGQKDFQEVFTIVEEKVSDELEDGELMLKICYLSVGPGCRNYMNQMIPIGGTMVHWTGGQVIASRDPRFKVGELVCGGRLWKWEAYSKVKISSRDSYMPVTKVPQGIDIKDWLALGANQGPTSYFGIVECGGLQEGDNVLVSAAAGATGNLVGQIAKIYNCHVVGICGSDDKCEYLKTLGFDDTINYKTTSDLSKAIKSKCPNGVDVYFDNIGSHFLEAAINNINKNARISICGQLASYNLSEPLPGPRNIGKLIWTCGRIQGFNILAYAHKWNEAIEALEAWIRAGKLIAPKLHVIEGLENAPDALTTLFSGENIGKTLVHVADPDINLQSKL